MRARGIAGRAGLGCAVAGRGIVTDNSFNTQRVYSSAHTAGTTARLAQSVRRVDPEEKERGEMTLGWEACPSRGPQAVLVLQLDPTAT